MTTRTLAGRALLLGVVAGSRSQLPLALLAFGGEPAEPSRPLALLRSRRGRATAVLAAAGEFVGDVLPVTPSRISPGPLAGRIGSGAAAGALLARRDGGTAVVGALLGAVGAVAGSYAGYAGRTAAVRATPVPDVVWAVVEDGLALVLGRIAVGGTRRA